MRNKKLIIWILSLLSQAAWKPLPAQVTMAVQLPTSGLTQKSQLWNLLLVNSTNGAFDAQIELTLTSVQTNQAILTAVSKRISLQKGAKVVQWTDVQPITYHTSGNAGTDVGPNGFLPVGVYRACFTLTRFISDAQEPIAEECADVEVSPLSPPQLSSPADDDTLESVYPQFSWLPPSPTQVFQSLTYEVRVVELLENQSYAEAVQDNLPITHQNQLRQAYFAYPATGKAFEKGKSYLWQVTARDASQYEVKTEVWRFAIRKETRPLPRQGTVYSRLQRTMSPAIVLHTDTLKIAYTNAVGDADAAYRIYPAGSDNAKDAAMKGKVTLVNGENFLDLPLQQNGVNKGESYWFELTNGQGEKWKMQFVYDP